MEQGEEVSAFNREHKDFRVLRGTEMDIGLDGSLDFPDEVLKRLDFVVAAIHSGFGQTREQLTARMVAAMRSPWVSAIAHPTGRLIGEREGYDVDMEMLLRVARETGTALEINSYPLRLDLNDVQVRRAKELGVTLVISSDLHVINQFDTLHYGVSVAQRGWLEKGDVLNTLELPELLKRLKVKRRNT
jgi:DNA polymerase (family X)